MCANTILKLFFINHFLLLCLGYSVFCFTAQADTQSADEFKSEKALITTTNYKPIHLFLSIKTL